MANNNSLVTAVILAAGRGTRLESITRNKPKCLVRVNGRTILDRQLDTLLAMDVVERVVIVCGYRGAQIKAHVTHQYDADPRVVCVDNPEFAATNNMFSFFLTREYVAGRDVILMNADVVCDPEIVQDLAQQAGNAIAVDVGAYAEESMKVTERDDRLASISKTILPEAALGVSIDIYRFTPDGTDILLRKISDIVEGRGERNEWTELAIDRLLQEDQLAVTGMDTAGKPWYEIDTLEDLWKAETLMGRYELDWDSVELAFVDMDGTLFRGTEPIAGADAFFQELCSRVPNVFLLSNNSSRAHTEYVQRLEEMGISARADQILLSSDALCRFLEDEDIRRVYAVGTSSFVELLQQHGIAHVEDTPGAVVLAYDTELSYKKLRAACLLLQDSEIRYLATHTDMVCPTEAGDVPDIGAMTELIEATCGRRPEQAFGKPERGMVDHVYDRLKIQPPRSIFVGDRAYTDYAMADACGARFVGVLTGDSDRADFEDCHNITIFPSVAEVFDQPDNATAQG